jgi:hypothetical protein
LQVVLNVKEQFGIRHDYAIGPRAIKPLVAAPVPRILT